MKTLVVGASGATGRLLVQQLLERGQRVRAIVRSLEGLPRSFDHEERLELIEASILDLSDDQLASYVRGCDAVASCLGHNMSLKGIFGPPRRLVTEATGRLCDAIRATGSARPTRFVLMNTAGNRNRDLDEPVSPAQACVIQLLRWLVPPHADNEEAAELLRSQIGRDDDAIRWVVVRPDGLTDEATVTGYELHDSPVRSAIFDAGVTRRIHVAQFMADLIVNDETWSRWEGQMPVIYDAEPGHDAEPGARASAGGEKTRKPPHRDRSAGRRRGVPRRGAPDADRDRPRSGAPGSRSAPGERRVAPSEVLHRGPVGPVHLPMRRRCAGGPSRSNDRVGSPRSRRRERTSVASPSRTFLEAMREGIGIVESRTSALVYLVVTFAWSWSFWATATRFDPQSNPASSPIFLIGGAGPFLAAVFFTRLRETRATRRDFWARAFDVRRIRGLWWLAALGLHPAIVALAFGVDSMLGGQVPEIDLPAGSVASTAALLFFVFWFGPFPEELGWRGFALDRLQSHMTALNASLLLGSLWALWHLPLFFIPNTFQAGLELGSPRSLIFLASMVPLSVLITWVYDNTTRSTLSAVLIHYSGNLSGELFDKTDRVAALELFFLVLAAVLVGSVWSGGRRRPGDYPSPSGGGPARRGS